MVTGICARCQIERVARDELEGGQLIGGRCPRPREEVHDVLDPAQPEEGGFGLPRFWEEFDRGGGNDPQRAFAADEQLLQVIAGCADP